MLARFITTEIRKQPLGLVFPAHRPTEGWCWFQTSSTFSLDRAVHGSIPHKNVYDKTVRKYEA